MNILTIIKAYLAERGYAGLASQNCGCGLEDLAPCGSTCILGCLPAHSRILAAGEYIGECGPGSTYYYVDPLAAYPSEETE